MVPCINFADQLLHLLDHFQLFFNQSIHHFILFIQLYFFSIIQYDYIFIISKLSSSITHFKIRCSQVEEHYFGSTLVS